MCISIIFLYIFMYKNVNCGGNLANDDSWNDGTRAGLLMGGFESNTSYKSHLQTISSLPENTQYQ